MKAINRLISIVFVGVAGWVIGLACFGLACFAGGGLLVIAWAAYSQPMQLLTPGAAGLIVTVGLDIWLLRRVSICLKK